MALVQMFYDLVAEAGIKGDWLVHVVECDAGHVIGYVKVPKGNVPWPLSVLCNECGLRAKIGGPLEVGKTIQPMTPIDQRQLDSLVQAKLQSVIQTLKSYDATTGELVESLVNGEPPKEIPKALSPVHEEPISKKKKSTFSEVQAQKLAEARARGRELREENWAHQARKVEETWEAFNKNKPKDASSDLRALIQQFPLRPRSEMSAETLFLGCWLGHIIWGAEFVKPLAEIWKCTTQALRQRIDSVFERIPDSLRQKMPFMAEATIRPAYWRKHVQEVKPALVPG